VAVLVNLGLFNLLLAVGPVEVVLSHQQVLEPLTKDIAVEQVLVVHLLI